MDKVSIDATKHFCPHPMALFLIGTYKENREANYGLFCWISACWDDGLRLMICMDGSKLTKDHIEKNKVFSANLVSENMHLLADCLGHRKGHDTSEIPFEIESVSGEKLDVPIFKESPLNYELEMKKTIELSGSSIYICKIHNMMVSTDSMASDGNGISLTSTFMENYYSSISHKIGEWGDWRRQCNSI